MDGPTGTNIFIGGVVILALLGVMFLGSMVFSNDAAVPKINQDLQILQYNREIIEQQQMIINALSSQNENLQKEQTALIERANEIIGNLTGNNNKTTNTATQ